MLKHVTALAKNSSLKFLGEKAKTLLTVSFFYPVIVVSEKISEYKKIKNKTDNE